MKSAVKTLANKLAIVVILIALCVTTGILHTMLVKNYETSTFAKYNFLTRKINMTKQVDVNSMKDVAHKMRVKIEAQKLFIKTIKVLTFGMIELQPRIDLYMTSGGGSVIAGFAVMNLMNKYQKEDNVKFVTVADGFCYSMCFALLQQGDVRLATKYTVLGTHPAGGGDPRVLRLIEEMTAENVLIKSEYFRERGFTAWYNLYIFDFYHNPELAKSYGLIDYEI